MRRTTGFTLMEVLVVLVIMAVTLTVVAVTFNRYLQRSSARRAAELFAQDLRVARSTAVRSRQPVVVGFDEEARRYVVRVQSGDTLVRRFFHGGSEITLSAIELQLSGDSLVFDSRGIGDLSGAGGSLGRAVFRVRNTSVSVLFNSMGASRVDGA